MQGLKIQIFSSFKKNTSMSFKKAKKINKASCLKLVLVVNFIN